MESTLSNTKKPETYPCLKSWKDTPNGLIQTIVLFTHPNVGTCVYTSDGGDSPLGSYSEEWLEEEFQLYDGNITLTN